MIIELAVAAFLASYGIDDEEYEYEEYEYEETEFECAD